MNTQYGTVSIRSVECIIASYFGIVGLFFIVDPAALAAPVYRQWQSMGPLFWGLMTVGVACLHFGALWLNGRAAWLSRPVRLVACVLHLLLALIFARMFIDGGAVWGAITYLALVSPLAILVCVPMARRWFGESNADF